MAISNGGDGRPPDISQVIDSPPLAACTPTSGMTMSTRMVGRVSGPAMVATSPPGDGRLFVVEQSGRVRVFVNEQLQTTPFLDITSKVTAGGEQGLLGLAFDRNYANNGYFYVWYTKGNCSPTCDDILERYTVSATDINKADAASAQLMLDVPDFATNHNAGMVEIGLDGFLYVSTGDGGSGGDPNMNGQNPNALLGKMLRIDPANPANGKPYGIPADNPYAAGGGAPEVFMLGLRNPWRWSFDRANGDMWIADVGQNQWEELDYLPAGQQLGKNLGWSVWEGNQCCSQKPPSDGCSSGNNYPCNSSGMTFPQFVHAHANGWSAIIGGQVYRGPCYPDLTGYYFFSDYSGHPLMMTKPDGTGGITTPVDVSPSGGFVNAPAGIHADARGELYVTTTDGYVYHLEAGP
jgi:glucose/arabinose dehydrogenase